MSFRKDVIEALYDAIDELDIFDNIYKNIVPVWSNIPQFPAVSILYESEEAVPANNTNSCKTVTGKILIYIFNKQESERQYEDILSEYIDSIYKLIAENEFLKCNAIDVTLASMKRDGGILHPFAMCQIEILVKYRQTF